MKQEIFWKNPHYKPFPVLKKNAVCEYLIVGGGITGVALAHFLSQKKKNVILIEKNTIASGATGRAAGVLSPDPELELSRLTKLYGKNAARALWDSYVAAFNQLMQLTKSKIPCQAEVLSSVMGHSGGSRPTLLLGEHALHNHSCLLNAKAIQLRIATKAFRSALYTPGAVLSVNPLQLTQNLARSVSRKVRVYEQTPLVAYSKGLAYTPSGAIRCKKIIFALDAFAPKVPAKKSTIIITQKLSKKEFSSLFPERVALWDDVLRFTYVRPTHDNRLLVGYGLENAVARSKLNKKHVRHALKFLRRVFPKIKWKAEYAWSGVYGLADDYLPLVRFDSDAVHVGASTGQVVSVALAQYIAERLTHRKKHPLDTVFQRSRINNNIFKQ